MCWGRGPSVLGRAGLVSAWGAKGPGPGRLGFGLGALGRGCPLLGLIAGQSALLCFCFWRRARCRVRQGRLAPPCTLQTWMATPSQVRAVSIEESVNRGKFGGRECQRHSVTRLAFRWRPNPNSPLTLTLAQTHKPTHAHTHTRAHTQKHTHAHISTVVYIAIPTRTVRGSATAPRTRIPRTRFRPSSAT